MANKNYRTYNKEDRDLKMIDDLAWKVFSDPKNKSCGSLKVYSGFIGGARQIRNAREKERQEQMGQ